MLYAATRNKSSVETAYKTVHLDCAGDGGLFTPFRMPVFERQEILQLRSRTFGQNMAHVLNFFFSANLTGWDIEFAVGRNPVQISTIPHRIFIAESWHNSQWKFDHVVQLLSDRLRGDTGGEVPTNWVRIAVRIAALFASYGQLLAAEQVEEGDVIDVAVTTGDFSAPMAAWYSRRMGLPVGNILCGCNANGGVWDLLNHGEMSTGSIAVRTVTPDADVAVPRNLERLVFESLGMEENLRYLDCCRTGGVYTLNELQLEQLREGLFAAVISDSRVESIIHSVCRTNNYVFSPYAALAYGCLLDYRAKTGESRNVLLLAERSPTCDVERVAKFLRTDTSEVFRRMSDK